MKKPIVLHFRREVELDRKPHRYETWVTADNRFILFVNGTRVASGPSATSPRNWRQEKIDLAPYLRKGRNVVAALVWDSAEPNKLPPDATEQQRDVAIGRTSITSLAPVFQMTVATGFRLAGDGDAAMIATDKPGWRVKRDMGRSFRNGSRDFLKYYYYVGSNPEIIDAAKADFDAEEPSEAGAGWQDAVPAPQAAARTLTADYLPQQLYAAASPGKMVRSDLAGAASFPARSVVVPAHSKVRLLFQRDAMIAAYPELQTSGGLGARLKLRWSEALHNKGGAKGDRDLVEDRSVSGIYDTFIADGKRRTFAPLWWRVWRYAELEVETADDPLTLESFRAFETGYPFVKVGQFASDDPDLNRIFDIGWRTARIDAHETYMDTAYWEQHQYAGDTRIQMLISYAMSEDPRLARQAIEAFGVSETAPGAIRGAYPSRDDRIMPTFGLLWIGMLDDWRLHQPDPEPLVRNIPLMRRVIAWWKDYYSPGGLVRKNPYWNFIDWIGQPATDRTVFPSYDDAGESCLLSVSLVGALDQAARLEQAFGDAAQEAGNKAWSDDLKRAIRDRCWDADRGLFADNPSRDRFSQHMNALAILYDVVTGDDARTLADRIVLPGQGLTAPEDVAQVSYYYAWYLAAALRHAGLADRYFDLLQPWRDMLALNLTTWPEEHGEFSRSDTHAWSAHPTVDLLDIVAGITPAETGYRRVRIAPTLGSLKSLDATAATPQGPVSVRYRVRNDKLVAEIIKPNSLPGDFIWKGQSHPLKNGTNHFVLPAQ
ncbi:hypothetical protein J3E64_003830 [Sphingobium sp. OAS761]|uniref:alpha-L-rhamnosidase-related protein n=1 Tax=Sphingobium sp. OAS761 TaxID=2817901 RepID=UPI00209CEB77|nr:alpha-L-rhamnosidase C-terminal domain-containing protein [Sphingobium sp. OAS761]MCP1472115.1 hypothetical protein [Sphingobium sp. OAS761]